MPDPAGDGQWALRRWLTRGGTDDPGVSPPRVETTATVEGVARVDLDAADDEVTVFGAEGGGSGNRRAINIDALGKLQVRDDYQASEYLADQAGAGAVLTFTFSSAVNLVVAQSTGSALTARATFDNGATVPSVTLGARLEDKSPVYAPLSGVTSIRVFAPTGTTISVWGARRS